MNYLLDTHTLIWLDSVPRKLSPPVASICKDWSNQLFVSIATLWEMQIKLQAGKLRLPTPIEEMIDRQVKDNRINLLAIELSHVLKLADLPDLHRDPFDRLLIAQALSEKLDILSADGQLAKYPVKVVW